MPQTPLTDLALEDRTSPPEPHPEQAAAAGASAAALVQQSLITEASATMLLEYLKRFFELVNLENRMIERRLESLEQTLDRVERRISADSAELEERVTTLEGVQLPLVRTQEQPRQESPASQEAPAAATPPPEASPAEEPELALAPPEAPGPPRVQTPDRSAAVEGRITISGLATFRMLASVRDTLKRSAPVLAAEPTHFEAGNAELRVRAIRPLTAAELRQWLAEATGERVEATGDLSFRVVAPEPAEA